MTPKQREVLEAMKGGQLMEMTLTGLRLDGRLLEWSERREVYPLLIRCVIALPVNKFGYGQGRLQPAALALLSEAEA